MMNLALALLVALIQSNACTITGPQEAGGWQVTWICRPDGGVAVVGGQSQPVSAETCQALIEQSPRETKSGKCD